MTTPPTLQRRQHRYGDFSTLNRLWNQSRSDTTHQRLQANPEEWAQYHTLYQESRKTWSVIPYEEMIRWCQQRSGYAIADFGCGEAKLAEAVSDRHTVYSFDHVAINNNVVACDMAHLPLNDEELDVAIFSLSLMGSNFTDYLREAHRTLKLDGQLHIIEATSRSKQHRSIPKRPRGVRIRYCQSSRDLEVYPHSCYQDRTKTPRWNRTAILDGLD
jgi:hypothetical protein